MCVELVVNRVKLGGSAHPEHLLGVNHVPGLLLSIAPDRSRRGASRRKARKDQRVPPLPSDQGICVLVTFEDKTELLRQGDRAGILLIDKGV